MIKSDLALSVGKGCHTLYPGNNRWIHLIPWAWFPSTEPPQSWAVLVSISPLLSLQEENKCRNRCTSPANGLKNNTLPHRTIIWGHEIKMNT